MPHALFTKLITQPPYITTDDEEYHLPKMSPTLPTLPFQKSKAFKEQLDHIAAAKQEHIGTKSLNYDNNKDRHNTVGQSIVIP